MIKKMGKKGWVKIKKFKKKSGIKPSTLKIREKMLNNYPIPKNIIKSNFADI
jgi:hypothetical protein